ncbi:thioredoxin family protein [Aureibacter tunicatorum]|uniref:Thiol-disulfide isomerase/thioredoxin n=1 Tax=Aureibacter tunicatorum TaxID=866807 RepID=A0AAE3XPZ5_9BACT|nr:thioredoxin family protein [Aureibacter tunicatorum]MDR6240573.1 thiol-disulfide isomerase/thioredoxin [Aureibacter tunicatorum]BDD06566.1 thioredoxin family protein [Aureibacter tunicatorum]
MALTSSNELDNTFSAPDFSLFDTISGQVLSLNGLKGDQGTVIMFICNHCPFVKHVNAELVNLANEYMGKGIGFIAISSNDVANYPMDSPEQMKLIAQEYSYPFAYLYDETQETAKAYHAACTPDFYVFDQELLLYYHGQLDDSRPGNDLPVTGLDMRKALDALLQGNSPLPSQKPSIGCNIKWKD